MSIHPQKVKQKKRGGLSSESQKAVSKASNPTSRKKSTTKKKPNLIDKAKGKIHQLMNPPKLGPPTTAKKGTGKPPKKPAPKRVTISDAFKTAFKEQPTPAERKAGATRALTVGRKRLTDAPEKTKKKKKK